MFIRVVGLRPRGLGMLCTAGGYSVGHITVSKNLCQMHGLNETAIRRIFRGICRDSHVPGRVDV